MRGEDIVMFCWPDLAGLTRGRSFPACYLEERLVKGIGWLPVSQVLTPFHELAEPNPWGAIDDTQLIGDPAAAVHVDLWEDVPPLRFLSLRRADARRRAVGGLPAPLPAKRPRRTQERDRPRGQGGVRARTLPLGRRSGPGLLARIAGPGGQLRQPRRGHTAGCGL